jgi:WD40 repeat protein
LVQYRIDDHQFVRRYKLNYIIYSITTTLDSKHIFVGLPNGSLHQICIDSGKLIKDYGKIHDEPIFSMVVTRDNNFLITCCSDETVKKISITKQRVEKDFGQILGHSFRTMQLAPGDESAFVYNYDCDLKLIDLTDGTTIKHFGEVHNDLANFSQRIEVTRDRQYLFTSSNQDGLKQFSVRDRALVQDFSRLGHEICSISE